MLVICCIPFIFVFRNWNLELTHFCYSIFASLFSKISFCCAYFLWELSVPSKFLFKWIWSKFYLNCTQYFSHWPFLGGASLILLETNIDLVSLFRYCSSHVWRGLFFKRFRIFFNFNVFSKLVWSSHLKLLGNKWSPARGIFLNIWGTLKITVHSYHLKDSSCLLQRFVQLTYFY